MTGAEYIEVISSDLVLSRKGEYPNAQHVSADRLPDVHLFMHSERDSDPWVPVSRAHIVSGNPGHLTLEVSHQIAVVTGLEEVNGLITHAGGIAARRAVALRLVAERDDKESSDGTLFIFAQLEHRYLGDLPRLLLDEFSGRHKINIIAATPERFSGPLDPMLDRLRRSQRNAGRLDFSPGRIFETKGKPDTGVLVTKEDVTYFRNSHSDGLTVLQSIPWGS